MSSVEFQIDTQRYQLDSAKAFDIAIPFRFDNQGVAAFGMGASLSSIVSGPAFCGDTVNGGSCNVEEYRIIPHCQGTHTECVGHVVNQPVSVADIVPDTWMPATLITVHPVEAIACTDRYAIAIEPQDWVIVRENVFQGLRLFDDARFHGAVILRTSPNPPAKKSRNYDSAPYFSNDAMDELCNRGVQHLLVDLPSVDRMQDQGRLSNHRRFWNLPRDGHDLAGTEPSAKTITELIYVPDHIPDGYYLLNLQIAPFAADAAPSRPLIYPVSQA